MINSFYGSVKGKYGKEVLVRQVNEADRENIKNFFISLSPRSASLFVPHTYTDEVIEERIARVMKGEDWSYVALDGEKCVGYFFLWHIDREIPMLGIGITDTHHDAGLGQQFMDILIEDGKKMNKAGIELTTMLDNDRAFHVYLKKGFIYLGNIKGEERVERSLFLPLVEGAVLPAGDYV